MASVGKMYETTHGNHMVYLADFNPETQELLIVAKDARRVWVEGYPQSELAHSKRPHWDGHSWVSGSHVYLAAASDGSSKLFGTPTDDCVEFVAVATHRPPEPEPEPLAKPMDLDEPQKSAVLKVYPQAVAQQPASSWYILDRSSGRLLSDYGPSEFMAWASAAKRIEDAANVESVSLWHSELVHQ